MHFPAELLANAGLSKVSPIGLLYSVGFFWTVINIIVINILLYRMEMEINYLYWYLYSFLIHAYCRGKISAKVLTLETFYDCTLRVLYLVVDLEQEKSRRLQRCVWNRLYPSATW